VVNFALFRCYQPVIYTRVTQSHPINKQQQQQQQKKEYPYRIAKLSVIPAPHTIFSEKNAVKLFYTVFLELSVYLQLVTLNFLCGVIS